MKSLDCQAKTLPFICLKAELFDDEDKIDKDFREGPSWERNGPAEKQFGLGLTK